jgi:ketosteroid isomerase-like protein
MNKLLLLVLLPMVFASSALRAQDIDAETRNAIMAIINDVERATQNRDVNAVLKHAAEGVVMVSKNGEIVVGKVALKAYLEKMIGAAPTLKELRSTLKDPRLMSPQRGLVIADGRSDDYYAFTSGLTFEITTCWTAAMVREAAGWKIAALHFSFNLFDNPLLSVARRMMLWAGALALAAGAALGAFGVFLKNGLKTNT